jgi:glucose-1-phosphate cytidylyltransferase
MSAKRDGVASTQSVPVLILAGGFGTRISEESSFKPKPMIEIGGIPILLHIMRHYYAHGFNNFVVCAGYKAIEIKKYFMYYQVLHNDLDIDHRLSFDESWKFGESDGTQEKWRVRVLDTGTDAMTGGRIAKALKVLARDKPFSHFAVTYGDGLSDVDLRKEYEFHLAHGEMGTVLGVKNFARYGELSTTASGRVNSFLEKPEDKQGFINGGFFFFRREFEQYLNGGDDLVLENQPLMRLAADGQLNFYKHLGFWHAMDTLRDRNTLEKLWAENRAPWVFKSATTLPPSPGTVSTLEPRA